MSKIPFPELHKILSEASEETFNNLIGVSPRDDGLSPGPRSNAGDDNKQPDLDPHALQASTSEPNFDDKGKQPVREPSMPQASTPATPTDRETTRRRQLERLYTELLSKRADTNSTVISAGDLRRMFTILGMSPEVTEDELRHMLKTTRYADESGLLDFEYFLIFSEDFELLESIHAYSPSQLKGGEYSVLGDLFNALAESHRDNCYRQECDDCFKQLLNERGDPTATDLPAGDLCKMLKNLGMPTKVKEDALQSLLTRSGYADGNGTLDFDRFINFAEDFKLYESLRAYKASKHKGGEYVERGPLRDFFKNFESRRLEPGRFPGSSSNDDRSNRIQPLIKQPVLPVSTSASPNSRDNMHRRVCKVFFNKLLLGDPNATALRAGALCGILKTLGMAKEVTDDELRDMLKFSGYTDEDGTLDFERFTIFAKDFVLLESLRVHKASQRTAKGPLGEFFEWLSSCVDLGEEFSDYDFTNAFDCLGIELTDETADVLARYANFLPGVEITFEQFSRFLRKEHEEYMQRTGQKTTSRRKVTLDKRYRLGRMMAFVSTYTRPEGAAREAVTTVRNNATEREGDSTNVPTVTPTFRIPK